MRGRFCSGGTSPCGDMEGKYLLLCSPTVVCTRSSSQRHVGLRASRKDRKTTRQSECLVQYHSGVSFLSSFASSTDAARPARSRVTSHDALYLLAGRGSASQR